MTTTTRSRIVLDEEIRGTVDAIQAKTRTSSPSAAIALLVSRYGRHLLETWELTAEQFPEQNPATFYPAANQAAQPSPDFIFTEPIQGL